MINEDSLCHDKDKDILCTLQWGDKSVRAKIAHTDSIGDAICLHAVLSRTTWRRPLMVRQPCSVAVPSTGGRLHPLVPEEREAW